MNKLAAVLIAGVFSVVMAQDVADVDQTKEMLQTKLQTAMQDAAPLIEKAQVAANEYLQLMTKEQKSALLEQKRISAEISLNNAIQALSGSKAQITAQTEQTQERFNAKIADLKQIQERIRKMDPANGSDGSVKQGTN